MSTPDVAPVAWRVWRETPSGDDLVLYREAKATVDALQERINELEKDAARMEWVQRNLLCADFVYKYQTTKTQPVLILAWPKNVGVSGNARAMIDDAIKAKP